MKTGKKTAMASEAFNDVPMRALVAGARRKEAEIIDLTRRLVLVESPSDDKRAVDACMDLAAEHGKGLGARVKRHRQKAWGDVLELRFGPRRKVAAERILVLGHLDTVWPLGTLKTMPWRIADDKAGKLRIWGPGTLDMKAGVSMAFTAIEMLLEASLLEREIVLLLNSEEEVGSPISRAVTEQLAAECGSVYVLEPAQGLAYKTSRKGTGNWKLMVSGVAAHAGVDFTRGRSAVLELTHLIEKVSGWTDSATLKRDFAKAMTVNVGVIGGGTKSNVVPAEAWAEVDVRVTRKSDGPRMEKRFAALKASAGSGCTLMVEGGINRPPMERTRGTVALFHRAQALAGQLDWVLDEAATGGASDGNFTSAVGVATLDGMGAVGEGAHATHESVLVEHLALRTALLGGMLAG
jgi:glutamate carboxypeptidase